MNQSENIPFCLFVLPKTGKKIVWEITSKCNMSCKHCCVDASVENFKELDFSNRKLIKEKINEILSLGFKEFYISGGEPFLVENIFYFLNFLKKKNIKVSVATNGYFLDELKTKELSKIKIDLLHISLDGHLAKMHNFLRRGVFFNTVTKNIETLLECKVPVRIGCIIWQQNENHLEDMVKFCINLGVKELRFSWLIKVGRFKSNLKIHPRRRYSSVIEEINKLSRKYKSRIKISIHRNLKTKRGSNLSLCPGGERLFFLNPEGNFSGCSWIAKIDPNFITKENLENNGIKNLIKSEEITRFREMVKQREVKNFKGCPFMSKYQNNSYLSKDSIAL